MGLKDIFRRKRADVENQGDDFKEDDNFIIPADKCGLPSEAVTENASDDQTGR